MKTKSPTRPITIFTPSFADEDNTNAQNLTVKEIVARLPAEQFRVIMISESKPDPRIAARKNTELLPYYKHGNTAQLLMRSVAYRPDIYFYPRFGPLDRVVFALRKSLRLRTAVVTHIVSVMSKAVEMLEALLEWRSKTPGSGLVFPSHITGRCYHAGPIQQDYFRPAARKLGLAGVCWHTFPHSYRSWMDEDGTAAGVQQKLLRHANLSTTTNINSNTSLKAKGKPNGKITRRVLPGEGFRVSGEAP